jgi:zinc protease
MNILTESISIPSSGITGLQIWIRHGSIHEKAEYAGTAHALEHMLFKGSTHYASAATVLEGLGWEVNAYTTFDHTVYHTTGPKLGATKALHLLLDTVFNSLIPHDEWVKEKEVILEEIYRSTDSPQSLLTQNTFKDFYLGLPIGRPILGYKETVKALTAENLREFYETFYCPERSFIVLGGDFNESELKKIISDFNPESRSLKTPWEQISFPQTFDVKSKNNIRVLTGPYEECRCQWVLPAPSLENHDSPLWDVFAFILGQSDDSRLVRTVQNEKGYVAQISAGVYAPIYTYGFLSIQFFGPAKNSKDTIVSILEEITQLSIEPPSLEEIQRAILCIQSQRIYSQETVEGCLHSLGDSLLTSQGRAFDENYYKIIGEASPTSLQKIAQSCLKSLQNSEFNLNFLVSQNAEDIPIDEISRLFISENTSNYHVPVKATSSIITHTLTQKRLPIISGHFIWKKPWETEKTQGLSYLMTKMMVHSTGNLIHEELVQKLENMASQISAATTWDRFFLDFESLKACSQDTFHLALECLKDPGFRAKDFETLHRETLLLLKAQKDQPQNRLSRITGEKLFGKDHPYSYHPTGTFESVSSFTLEDVKSLWTPPHTLYAAFAGDLENHSIFSFDTFKPQVSPEPLKDFPQPITTPGLFWDPMERDQVHIRLSFLGLSSKDPDKYVMEMLCIILSGQGGRLFLKLRDELSLAYTVHAWHTPMEHSGVFSLYIGTHSSKVQEAMNQLWEQLHLLLTETIGEEEWNRARNSFLGSELLQLQYLSHKSQAMAMNLSYGLPAEDFKENEKRILAITPQDISRVLKKILIPNSAVWTCVGPEVPVTIP